MDCFSQDRVTEIGRYLGERNKDKCPFCQEGMGDSQNLTLENAFTIKENVQVNNTGSVLEGGSASDTFFNTFDVFKHLKRRKQCLGFDDLVKKIGLVAISPRRGLVDGGLF